MNGHVRKRGVKWEVVVEKGEQPAQRCPACVDSRGRSRLYWSDGGRLELCPTCQGPLEDVTARRKVLQTGYATKKQASEALTRALHAGLRGRYVSPDKLTVATFLVEQWLPTIAGTVRETTQLVYRLHVEKHIVPHIGELRLQNLTTRDVDKLYATLASTPGARGKPLSPATCRAVHRVLHRALVKAVEWDLIARNPADSAERPRITRHEMTTWTRRELTTFLQLTEGDRLFPLWRLLAMTGLRRGEALGLRWHDVDTESGRITVRRQRVQVGYRVEEYPTLKGGAAHPVSIDGGTVAALRRQSQQQLDDAAEWQAAWIGDGHVFCRENGEPWQPDRVTKLFDQAVKASGATRIRLHDLRHTHATLALQAGIHPKVVQERLGHATVAMTMDTYSHVIPALQESAAELVAALVDGES